MLNRIICFFKGHKRAKTIRRVVDGITVAEPRCPRCLALKPQRKKSA